MIGQVFEKEGKKYIVLMKDIFYYARFYGIDLPAVNFSLIGYPLNIGVNKENGKIKVIWIRYKTCKDCADYMLESKNCYKTKNCLIMKKIKKVLTRLYKSVKM